VVPASEDFLVGARKLCDKVGALLVFDEIQTGMGRTGSLYAYMNTPVVPDILTTAKALGGGFPVAAMITTAKIAQSLGIGTHGSTYGGNPLACAVAETVMDIINQPDLLAAVSEKGQAMRNGLNHINKKYGVFEAIRGQGALVGAALKPEWHGKAKSFVNAALEEGLMILVAGPNVLRFAPSLIIPDEDIAEGMDKLDKAVANLV
jgi:acetylornithine/N-succinyldiaminopimelate aminotransferase